MESNVKRGRHHLRWMRRMCWKVGQCAKNLGYGEWALCIAICWMLRDAGHVLKVEWLNPAIAAIFQFFLKSLQNIDIGYYDDLYIHIIMHILFRCDLFNSFDVQVKAKLIH